MRFLYSQQCQPPGFCVQSSLLTLSSFTHPTNNTSLQPHSHSTPTIKRVQWTSSATTEPPPPAPSILNQQSSFSSLPPPQQQHHSSITHPPSDLSSHEHLINQICYHCDRRNPHLAEHALRNLRNQNLKPSLSLYRKLIDMYSTLNNPLACISTLRALFGEGHTRVPPFIIEATLRTCCRHYQSGHLPQSQLIDCIRLVEEHIGHKLRANAWNMLLKSLGLKDMARARMEMDYRWRLSLRKGGREGWLPGLDLYAYNTLLSVYSKNGWIKEAVLLFGEMVGGRGIKPDLITYNRLLEGPLSTRRFIYRVGFVGEGGKDGEEGVEGEERGKIIFDGDQEVDRFIEAVCRSMKRHGVERDCLSETLLLKLRSKIHSYQSKRYLGNRSRIWALWKEVKNGRKKVDLLYYNTLIHAFSRCGDVTGGLSALTALRKDGLKADLYTYNSLLAAAGRVGKVDVATKILKTMRRVDGCHPDQYSYCSILTACARCRPTKPALAEVYLDEAIEEKVTWSNAMVNSAIISNGDDVESALTMWKRIRLKAAKLGMGKFDGMVYESLLHVCGAAGRPGDALKLVYAMRKEKIKPRSGKSLYSAFQRGVKEQDRALHIQRDFVRNQYLKLLQVECRVTTMELPLARVRVRY